MGITQLHTLSNESQRFLGIVNQFGGLIDCRLVEFGIRHVGTYETDLLRIILYLLHLRVLGKVEHHRTRTPRASDIESPADSPCHVFGMTDLITPLRDWLRHAHKVHLLKGVGTKGSDGYLSGDDNNRRGVEHRIGDTRQCVRHTWTAGHQGHTYLTRHSGIALGGVSGSLLMTHQYMIETFLLASCVVEERIIHGHDAATGIAEDGLHPLSLQRPHQRLRSCNSVS